MRLWISIGLAAASFAGATLVALVWFKSGGTPVAERKSGAQRPTLYCEFFSFTHSETVVSFNFAVGRDAEKVLSFSELFVVEPDGTKTDHADAPPQWAYSVDDGTPVITSPDSATRIVLYGLRPGTGGVFWTEAGVRSNMYRNLEGKCRQAHFDKIVDAKAEEL